MSIRIAEVILYCDSLSEEQIKAVLSEQGSFESYALALHNMDVYTSEDEKQNPKHKKGTPKAPHMHIIFKKN